MKLTKPNDIKFLINTYAKTHKDTEMPTEGKRGALIGAINKAVNRMTNDANDDRRLMLGYLFTPDDQPMQPLSSSALDGGQWFAVGRWVGSWMDTEGIWQTRPEFPLEAQLCVNWARYYLGLTEIDKELGDQIPLGVLEREHPYGVDKKPIDVEVNSMVTDSVGLGAVVQECEELPIAEFKAHNVVREPEYTAPENIVEDPGIVPI